MKTNKLEKNQTLVVLQNIIDKNTVDGCYSPDGIAKDVIMYVGAKAITNLKTKRGIK